MKSKAMLKPGNISPTIGTSIDGKYDAVMFIYDKYKLIIYY